MALALAASSAAHASNPIDYEAASTDDLDGLSGKGQLEPLVRYVVGDYMDRHGVKDPLTEEYRVQLILELIDRESDFTNLIDRHDPNGRGGRQIVYGYLQFVPSTYKRMRGVYEDYLDKSHTPYPKFWDECQASRGIYDPRCQIAINCYAWGQGSLIREWGPVSREKKEIESLAMKRAKAKVGTSVAAR